MRTKLLIKLRRKARKEYFLQVWRNSGIENVCYMLMHKEPFLDECEDTIWDMDLAVKKLENRRRKFIKNEIEVLRFKKLKI